MKETQQLVGGKIDSWVDAFVEGCFEVEPKEQPLAVAIYRQLADGQPVSLGALARYLNTTIYEVQSLIVDWSGVYYDSDHIVGFWGLALPEMDHRFEVEGKTIYTWCAWDSLFIPEIIGKTASVSSTCPVTGDLIRLEVTPRALPSMSRRI